MSSISINKSDLKEMIRVAIQEKLQKMKKDGAVLKGEGMGGGVPGAIGPLPEARRKLQESTDSGTGAFAKKVDELVESQISDIDKLVKEGEDLMKDSPTHDYAVQERNHLISARIGILKAMKVRLTQVLEDLYKNV